MKHVDLGADMIYSFTSESLYEWTGDNAGKEVKPLLMSSDNTTYRVAPWGVNNLLPYDHIKLIYENPDKPTLIKNKVNLSCGRGVLLYRHNLDEAEKENRMYIFEHPIYERLNALGYTKVMRETATDLEQFANSWMEIVLNNEKTKVSSVTSLDATDCRLEMVKERSNQRVLLADWKKGKNAKSLQKIPLFDPLNPTKHKKFAIHIKELQSGQPYYSLVEWNGSKVWTEVANNIPKFHRSGLKNGYNIKYHIKIPSSYLDQFPDEEQRNKKKKEVQTMLDDFLGGPDNAQKTFFSFVTNVGGNPVEWKIDTVGNELNDEAYLKLDEHASKAAARGHNIHPVLAGIYTTGSLGSGSEILNLANFHIAYKTNDIRQLILDPLYIIGKIEGWDPKIKFTIKDVQFTTTDKNPTGQQNVTQE